ncbi:PREDICTED: tuftelin-like, partial [Pseudopodoces humilis]|uniref:tuftelin-like n=1 Tax=Pseudopodoces humilis TaxID=181119 RepID=UPI0006B6DDEA
MNGLQGWAALLEKAQELSMRRPTEFPEFPSLENSPGSPENSGGDPRSAWNPEEAGPGLRLRLPRDPPGDRPKQKPVGRAFAMVAKRSDGNSLASECVKSKDGDEEIIKVYLRTRSDHEEPVTQLKSEVRHIQEAGSVLKKLREDLSTKLQSRTEFQEFQEFREFQESSEAVLENNGSCSCPGNSQENPRWQEQLRERAERAERGRRRAEQEAAERELRVQELQRLLENTEKDWDRDWDRDLDPDRDWDQDWDPSSGLGSGSGLGSIIGIFWIHRGLWDPSEHSGSIPFPEQRDLRERLELGQAELRRLREAEGTRAAQQER